MMSTNSTTNREVPRALAERHVRFFRLWTVLALYLVTVALINPLRECPVIDDWAYAKTVWHFVNTGEYKLHPWLSANIPFQTLWGSLFCRALGNTFSALRLSTIVLAVVGLI